MREILFKAKRIDNGEWVEGYVFDDDYKNGRIFVGRLEIQEYKGSACDDWNIVGSYFYEVDKNTICQYTGLTDKNGRKIWENDIIKTQEYTDRPYSDKSKSKRHIGVVEYHIGQGNGFYNEETGEHNKNRQYSAKWRVKIKDYGKYHRGNWGDFFDCEVIGNIFDNKELLEN